ncbi:MAG: response regulator transcription factor [Bacteroidetes bacterium]|nr:response regulator transcription factor [Bacteroidota bacterium]
MIKLLIADDHKIFIDGIINALSEAEDIDIVATATNGVSVLDILQHKQVDVVLMDISMPVMHGIECSKKIRDLYPDKRVIILSQFCDERLIKRLMKFNIYGYLVKNSEKEDIIEAIRKVYQGERVFTDGDFAGEQDLSREFPKYNAYNYSLSKREKQVLELICNGEKNDVIAEKLNISNHTVETYRSRLMVKSGMRNTAELVKWAFENDLVY